MPDATNTITLSAALIAGIAGSGHCFAMCGGLAGALGMRARTTAASPTAAFHSASIYHIGRLGGYTLAGALCGLFGAGLQAVLDLAKLSVTLRVASGVLLILVAIRILFAWNALGWLERFGARFWGKLQPLVRNAAASNDTGRSLLLGLLWGWLPCGLVYSMLLFAALSGNAVSGAAIMLAFGIGTLPSMLTSSVLVAQIHAWLRQRWPRIVSGALLLGFGVWVGWAAVQSAEHGQSHGAVDHTQHYSAPPS